MQNFARPFDAIARASPSTTWNVDSPNSACESLPKATRYLFKPYQIHLTQTIKQLACTPTTSLHRGLVFRMRMLSAPDYGDPPPHLSDSQLLPYIRRVTNSSRRIVTVELINDVGVEKHFRSTLRICRI